MKRFISSFYTLCLLCCICIVAEPLFAQISVTYEAPGVLNSTVSGSQFFDFNSSPLGVNATLSWAGVGTFNNAKILAPDKYGGAGGSQYLQVPANSTMTLNLNTPQSYFGFWWSAGDSRNSLTFKLGSTVVVSFNTAILNSFLSSSYNGMPSGPFAGQNQKEKYAFINFYGINGATFDTIVASQGTSAAFESDNWSIATTYTNPLSGTPIINYSTTPSGSVLTNVLIATNSTLSNTVTATSVTVTPTSTLVGSGTLTATLTNQGEVIMNGMTINGEVTNGGVISGSGTINGNTTNSGTISTGPSGGTISINGNLVETPTSQTVINVENSTNQSTVVVNGSANLSGTVVIAPVDTNSLHYGDQYNVITATGGITGSNSVVTPEGIRGRELTNSTNESILIAPQSYTQVAKTPNQIQAAKALDSFISSPNPDNQTVSTALDRLTAVEYPEAFNAVMPTLYQSLSTIAFNLANAQNSELVQRLWGLRVAEGGGFSMSGFSEDTLVYQEPTSTSDGKEFKNPFGGKDFKQPLSPKKDILRPGADNRWGMFVDGNGIFAQANSGNMLPGYNSQSGGVTTGLTYKWNESFASGLYAGYEGTYAKYGATGSGLGTGSSLIDNSVRFGLFGTYGQPDGKGFYADALAGGGYNNYRITRVIQFSGLNRTANSSPGAGELDTMLAGGYDIKRGPFTFGPTASLQYTYLGVDPVSETGAQSLDFSSGGWNTSSMLSSVGAHAAYTWRAGRNIVVVPQISLSWQHEFMQNPYPINGTLGGTSPTFSNWSSTPIRDTLYTGVGFTVEFAKRWNTAFFYNASAGNSDLVSQNIFWSAGLKF